MKWADVSERVFVLTSDHNSNSLARYFRKRRMRLLSGMLARIENPKILDVGGTPEFWDQLRSEISGRISITVLNRAFLYSGSNMGVSCVIGDGRTMAQFGAGEFDVCFSNSVLEHVGGPEDQAAMAREIRRVGRGYFVQTPNTWFPIEPHFLVPMWGMLPMALRVSMLQKRSLGWVDRANGPEEARSAIESIRMLSARRLAALFPDGKIARERIGPLTKSLLAIRTP